MDDSNQTGNEIQEMGTASIVKRKKVKKKN